MAVSRTAEYALRAVVRLAKCGEDSQNTQQLSQATSVPQSYLPKVLQPLTRAGIVAAQRGSRGGYSLLKDPQELTVLEVVECVDPFPRGESSSSQQPSDTPEPCALRQLLSDTKAYVRQRFSEAKIGELLNQPRDDSPLCDATAETESAAARIDGTEQPEIAH